MPYTMPDRYPCCFCECFASRLEFVPLLESGSAIAEVSDCERTPGAGAMLVSPRAHVETVSRLSEAQAVDLVHLVFRSMNAVYRAMRPNGFHTFCSAGVLVGQSQAHLHVQVQPRYDGRPYLFAPAEALPTIPLDERRAMARRIGRCLESDRTGSPSLRTIDVPPERLPAAEFGAVLEETPRFSALVHPQSRGFGAMIIVPRRPVSTFLLLSEAEREDLILLIVRLCRRIESVLEPDGLSVWWDTGRAANQAYADFIVELVPRFAATPYRHLHRGSLPVRTDDEHLRAASLYRGGILEPVQP